MYMISPCPIHELSSVWWRLYVPVHWVTICLDYDLSSSGADSRFAPSQWETALLCSDVSHWLGGSLESVLSSYTYRTILISMKPGDTYTRQWTMSNNGSCNCLSPLDVNPLPVSKRTCCQVDPQEQTSVKIKDIICLSKNVFKMSRWTWVEWVENYYFFC